MKKVGFIALALLAAFGVLGLVNGSREWGDGVTALQRSVAVAVLLHGVCGVCGVLGVIGMLPGRRVRRLDGPERRQSGVGRFRATTARLRST